VRFSELDGARVGVWGAGREISSLARQLRLRMPSARIVAAVFDSPPSPAELAALDSPDARVLGPEDAVSALSGCDVLVRSPGVSIHRPEIRALAEAGVPVTTATALWLEEVGGDGVLGITGTKGKSTTAALAVHLARAAGLSAELAGNIGAPALDLLGLPRAQVTVLELSSYQIADLQTGPESVLFTSLFPEHADWHGSEEAYRAEKLRILTLPGVRSVVLNGREEVLLDRAGSVSAALTLYGVPGGWDLAADGITLAGELLLSCADMPLLGEHNALNLCGALAGLQTLGVAAPELGAALRDFSPLPHRLQTVADADGVLWVNDSISTTPESTIAALASFPDRAIVLIAGGQDRGQDHRELARVLAGTGASVIGVPTTGPRLIEAARAAGVPPDRALQAGDLADAVRLARAAAIPGGVVLLSPAAPSYDNFRNFEQRGEVFAELAAAPGGVRAQP
jgi:UDP-N-acetylmuramoylalanine--D-glutamate ligase